MVKLTHLLLGTTLNKMKKRFLKICKLAFDKETYKSFGKDYAELLYQRSLDDGMIEMFNDFSDEDLVLVLQEEYASLSLEKKFNVPSSLSISIIEKLNSIEEIESNHPVGVSFMARYDYDMIKEENENLKIRNNEFNEAFIELKKHFESINLLSIKMSYMTKILLSKNMTEKEKIKLSEDFDKVTTKENFKLLYDMYNS